MLDSEKGYSGSKHLDSLDVADIYMVTRMLVGDGDGEGEKPVSIAASHMILPIISQSIDIENVKYAGIWSYVR